MTSKLSNMWTKAKAKLTGVLALGLLAGCAAQPGGADNPITNKFQWFSYIEGGDFRNACGPGAPDRYRIIYNAVYTEQVRIYELTSAPMRLHTRVLLPMDLRDFRVDSLGGLLDPWRGQAAGADLSAPDMDALVADLDAFGAFGSPNQGAELSSKGFFWTVAACHKGRYHFTGFPWPSAQWDQARFTTRLFALDPTGVPVNEPRKTKTSRELGTPKGPQKNPVQQYHLKVGKNGLVGWGTLF